MAEVLSGNSVEEEFAWSVTLDTENKSYEWNPAESSTSDAETNGKQNGSTLKSKKKDDSASDGESSDEDDDDDEDLKPGHRLTVKNVFLDVKAKDGEMNVVKMECLGYGKAKVACPIAAMKGGADYQRFVDQTVPSKATFTLVSGNGPVHLVGTHVVDMYGYRDLGGTSFIHDNTLSEAEEEEDEDVEEEEAEEEEEPVKLKGKKKKQAESNGKTPTKNGKKKRKAESEDDDEEKSDEEDEVKPKKKGKLDKDATPNKETNGAKKKKNKAK